MHRLGKPRIFLSYASRDAGVAEALYRVLTRRGFEVFRDSAAIVAGENFVEVILANLRRADAVVALQTSSSAASDWCQAELHHAYALRKKVIPVRLGERSELVRPLVLLQRQVHTLEVRPDSPLEEVPAELERDLTIARRRGRVRQLRAAGTIALIASAVLLLGVLAISKVNSFQQSRERSAALDRIESSQKALAQETLDSYSDRFATDPELLKSLLLLRLDDSRSDTARFNAWLLGGALLADRNTERRWVLDDVDADGLRVEEARLENATISSGSIRDVVFQRSTFSGVVWGEGPSETRAGLVLSNLRFVDSDFYFTWFAGTTAVGLDFVNSSFRGSEIDLTRLSLVSFVSEVARPDLETLITDEVTVIENSVILNRNRPPDPGVLDLSVPTEEALFEGVVFVGTHFRGYIRPEWFRRCVFRNCVFPVTLQGSDLQAGENLVDDCYWRDEPLD